MAASLLSLTGTAPPSTSGVDSGLTGIDAILAQSFSLLASQSAASAKANKIAQNATRRQSKKINNQFNLLNTALKNNPNPSSVYQPPPSMSSADVVAASDRVRMDASKRNGMKRSIMAGETSSTFSLLA